MSSPACASNTVSHVPHGVRNYSGLSIGLTYALAFATYGVLIPFIALIFKAHGLSDAETSVALSATGLAALVAPLSFAHVADRKLPFRLLMPALLVGGAGAFYLLNFSTTPFSAFITTFAIYFFLIPALTLLDSFTMDFIIRSNSGKRARKFEHYRIWGSIGFMVPSLLLLIFFGGNQVRPKHLISMGIIVSLAAAACAILLPHNEPTQAKHELPSRTALAHAIRPPLRGLFLANIIAGLGLSIFYVLYPRFLQEVGCSTVEVGLIINLGVAWEVALMPFAATLIRLFGLERVVLLGLLTIPVRLLITCLWPTITVAIVTQVLHAPLVIGLFVAIPIYLQTHADSTFRHSLQSLNVSLVQGFARFIGPGLGAYIVSTSPGDELQGILRALLATAVLGGCAAIIFATSSRKDSRHQLSRGTSDGLQTKS